MSKSNVITNNVKNDTIDTIVTNKDVIVSKLKEVNVNVNQLNTLIAENSSLKDISKKENEIKELIKDINSLSIIDRIDELKGLNESYLVLKDFITSGIYVNIRLKSNSEIGYTIEKSTKNIDFTTFLNKCNIVNDNFKNVFMLFFNNIVNSVSSEIESEKFILTNPILKDLLRNNTTYEVFKTISNTSLEKQAKLLMISFNESLSSEIILQKKDINFLKQAIINFKDNKGILEISTDKKLMNLFIFLLNKKISNETIKILTKNKMYEVIESI